MSENPLLVPLAERTLYIYPPEVEDEISSLNAQITEALTEDKSRPKRLGGSGSKAIPLAEALDALKEAAADRPDTRKIVIRQVPNVKVRQLIDKHPPRKGNKLDEQYGFNESTFFAALLRAALVSPEVTDEQFEEFVATCPPRPWNRICGEAYALANHEVELPKSSAVLAVRRVLSLDSEPQHDSE